MKTNNKTNITTISLSEESIVAYGFVLPKALTDFESFNIKKDVKTVANAKEWMEFLDATEPTIHSKKQCERFIKPYLSLDMVKIMETEENSLYTDEEKCTVNDEIKGEVLAWNAQKFANLNKRLNVFFKEYNKCVKSIFNALMIEDYTKANELLKAHVGVTFTDKGLNAMRKASYNYARKKYFGMGTFRRILLNVLASYTNINTIRVMRNLVHNASGMCIPLTAREYANMNVKAVDELVRKHCPKKADMLHQQKKMALIECGAIQVLSDETIDYIRNDSQLTTAL